MAATSPSYYEILGVTKDADDRQIKKVAGGNCRGENPSELLYQEMGLSMAMMYP